MRRLISITALLAVGAVMLVMLFAGVFKLAALDQTAIAFAAFDAFSLPESVAATIALVLSGVEILIALTWAMDRVRRPGVQFAAIFLLALFILILTIQLRYSNPPDCACLGLLQKFQAFAADARGELKRVWWLFAIIAAGTLVQHFIGEPEQKAAPS